MFLKEQMYDGRLQNNFSWFLKGIKIVCKEGVTEITSNQGIWFSGRKGTQVLALVLLRQGQAGCCMVAVGSSRTPARARAGAARQEEWGRAPSHPSGQGQAPLATGNVPLWWHWAQHGTELAPCCSKNSPQISACPWINFLEQFVHHELQLGLFFPLWCPLCLALFCTSGFCFPCSPIVFLSPLSQPSL